MDSYFIATFQATVILAFMCAVIGWVYVRILTQPGQVLSFWKVFLVSTYDEIFGINTPASDRYRWILMPIVECELCVTGQLALWLYLFLMKFILLYLIFCICLAILIAKTLNQLLKTS